MKHVVSFSGGRTSAYLAYVMEQKRRNDGWDVSYVFMDTGAEHPKTYEFVKNVVEHFGIELTCLRTRADTPLVSVTISIFVRSMKSGRTWHLFGALPQNTGTHI